MEGIIIKILKTKMIAKRTKGTNAKNYKGSLPFFVFVLLSFIISSTAIAQDISFTAQAQKLVKTGETFQIIFTVNDRVDNFQPPSFDGFQVLTGPMTGSSTSIQMVNGKTTRTTSITYTYYLRGVDPGVYNLHPAKAVYKKNPIESNALTIEVVGQSASGGNTPSMNQPSTDSDQSEQPTVEESSNENHFARLIVDKKSAYIGEQVTAYLKIYTKLNISNADLESNIDYNGFYKVDLEDPNMLKLVREKVGNDLYNAVLLQKVLLYPQRSGTITIDAININTTVREQASRPQSVFDEFFGSAYANRQIKISTKPVTIKIKPFPNEGQPAGFSGAVGTFSMNTTINNTDVSTNDAITIKVTISGKGNVKLLEGVQAKFPPTFEVFDPVEKVILNKEDQGRSGRKEIEYTLIPRHAGDFEINPILFSYFDPTTGRYKSLESKSFDVHVEKSATDSTTTVISGINQKQVELLGSDIKYIETKFEIHPIGHFYFGTTWFWAVYVFAFISILFLAIIVGQQRNKQADTVSLQRSKASKIALKRLRLARQLMKENKSDAFFEETTKALWGYVADKISIPVADLSVEKARIALMQKGVDNNLTDDFINVAQECEFARYAPGAVAGSLSEHYEKVSKVITKIEQSIK